jgi:hypothetical protein
MADTSYVNAQYCATVPFFSYDNWFGRCAGVSVSEWQNLAAFQPPPVGAPPDAALTTAPASGNVASETINTIVTAQMQNWQQSNAGYVQPVSTFGVPSSITDFFSSTDSSGNPTVSWWKIGLIGLSVGAVVSMLGKKR